MNMHKHVFSLTPNRSEHFFRVSERLLTYSEWTKLADLRRVAPLARTYLILAGPLITSRVAIQLSLRVQRRLLRWVIWPVRRLLPS